MTKAVLYTDGGSRGNPGPSGLGFHLHDLHGQDIARGGWYLLCATNNEAEYSALIWGLENALAAEITSLKVYADSQLIVRQMQGIYQVKSKDLKPLFLRAKNLFSRFEEVSIDHVYRADNTEADLLANEAMDAMHSVGNFVIPWEAEQKNLFDQKQEPELDHQKQEVGFEKRHEEQKGTYELSVTVQFEPSFSEGKKFWNVELSVQSKNLNSDARVCDAQTLKNDLKAFLDSSDFRDSNAYASNNTLCPSVENLSSCVYTEFEKRLPKGLCVSKVAIENDLGDRIVFRV